jgi:hypothetical protein
VEEICELLESLRCSSVEKLGPTVGFQPTAIREMSLGGPFGKLSRAVLDSLPNVYVCKLWCSSVEETRSICAKLV